MNRLNKFNIDKAVDSPLCRLERRGEYQSSNLGLPKELEGATDISRGSRFTVAKCYGEKTGLGSRKGRIFFDN